MKIKERITKFFCKIHSILFFLGFFYAFHYMQIKPLLMHICTNLDKLLLAMFNTSDHCFYKFNCVNLASIELLETYCKMLQHHFISLLRQTSSYFQRCKIFISCTSARQKNDVRFTGKCMLYSLCQLPPEFSILFLFKINNSLYISFQSFINMQILTISHIFT